MPSGAPPKHARDGGRTASAGGAHSHPNDPELPLLRLVAHYRLYSKHRCTPKQGQHAVSPMPGPGGGCRRVLDHLCPLCRKAPGVQEPQGPPGEGTGERPRKSPGLLACPTQQVLTAPQTWHKHACALMSIPPPGTTSLARKVKGTYGRPSCTPCPPLTYHCPRRPEGAREPACKGLQAGWCSLGWARDHSAGSAHSSCPAALTGPHAHCTV